jgi:hypothetical protein
MIINANNPEYDGTEASDWSSVDKTMDGFIDGYYKHNPDAPRQEDDPVGTVGEMPVAMKEWIAARTLNGSADADTTEGLISYPVVNPDTNKLNKNALVAAKPYATQECVGDVAAKADQLLQEEFDVETNESESPGVLNWFKRKFLRIFSSNRGEDEEETEIYGMSYAELSAMIQNRLDRLDRPADRAWHFLEEINTDGTFIYSIRDLEGETKPKYFRAGYSVSDEEVTLDIDNSEEVKQVWATVNNQGSNNDKEDIVTKEEMIAKLIGHCSSPFGEGDKEVLGSLSEEKLKGYLAHADEEKAAKNGAPAASPAANDDNDKDKGQEKIISLADFKQSIPSEFREVLDESLEERDRTRGYLIKEIAANSANDFTEEELANKPLSELRKLARLARIEVDYSVLAAGAHAPRKAEPETVPAYVGPGEI